MRDDDTEGHPDIGSRDTGKDCEPLLLAAVSPQHGKVGEGCRRSVSKVVIWGGGPSLGS